MQVNAVSLRMLLRSAFLKMQAAAAAPGVLTVLCAVNMVILTEVAALL